MSLKLDEVRDVVHWTLMHPADAGRPDAVERYFAFLASNHFRRDAKGWVPPGHDGFCCGGVHKA